MCYTKSIPKLIWENPSEIVDIIKYRAKHHITIPFDDGLNEPVNCNLGMSKIAFETNLQKVSGLYLFRVNQDGLYKIGLSKDIVQRHGQHEGTYKQIMSADGLHLIAYVCLPEVLLKDAEKELLSETKQFQHQYKKHRELRQLNRCQLELVKQIMLRIGIKYQSFINEESKAVLDISHENKRLKQQVKMSQENHELRVGQLEECIEKHKETNAKEHERVEKHKETIAKLEERVEKRDLKIKLLERDLVDKDKEIAMLKQKLLKAGIRVEL